jgi:hypothetical protein
LVVVEVLRDVPYAFNDHVHFVFRHARMNWQRDDMQQVQLILIPFCPRSSQPIGTLIYSSV